MFCSTCGSLVPPDCAYCLQCGRQANQGAAATVAYVAPAPSPTPPTVAPASWRTPLLLFILGVAIIFSGFMLYFLLRDSSTVAGNVNNSPPVRKEASPALGSPSPSPTVVLTDNRATPAPTASSSEAIWYVMLGGYREPNWATAETRRDKLQGQGFNAYIVDTNLYQNLDPNLHAIVMGPYTKDKATDVANQLKSIQPDVYIKWARLNR